MVKGKNNYQEYNNITFKNETELEFYKMCEVAQQNNLIKSFEFECLYELQPSCIDWRDDKIAPITHIPDFKITLMNNEIIIVDSKGGNAFTHDEVAVLKRKIWIYQNEGIPYYMVSKCPRFLGSKWVETSKSHDFLGRLKKRYDILYPNVNKRLKDTPKFTIEEWGEYFEFHNIVGLFYVMDKMYTKKELEKRK